MANQKKKYIEGLLTGYTYARVELLKLTDRKKELEYILAGRVTSPTIKSTEEAKYTRGTPVFRDEIIDAMDELEQIEPAIRQYSDHVNTVDSFLNSLEKSDADMIKQRYIRGKSFDQLAVMFNMSANGVWKRIEKILNC